MKYLTYQELKALWYAFFRAYRHKQVKAVSLVTNDRSLLWINSGVAGLKRYFLSQATPPARRLVNIQNAVRTNDLTLIGKTNRHLTLFEMMGNFALNDYFKVEALKWAWEFLTSSQWLNLPKHRFYFTVWEEDQTTIEFLQTTLKIPPNRFFRKGRETNFWDLGVGPCGPNAEIFYDCGPAFDPQQQGITLLKDDIENDRYLEVWNIVFSEFNNVGKNDYQPLMSKNIDTGAGLERLLMICQQTQTLFATDAFTNLRTMLETASNKQYLDRPTCQLSLDQQTTNRAFAILIDHLRAVTFMLTDLLTSKTGSDFSFQTKAGYVVRRLLRNAFLHLATLNLPPPFLANLVPIVVKTYQHDYPLLKTKQATVQALVAKEEAQISKIWQPALLNPIFATAKAEIPGAVIFDLVTSKGIPLELLEAYALKENKLLDLKSYANLLARHRQVSRVQSPQFTQAWTLLTSKQKTPTPFFEHAFNLENCQVIAVFPHQDFQCYWVIFTKTPFYATKGGQVADQGTALFANFRAQVLDVRTNAYGEVLHLLYSPEKPRPTLFATLSIDQSQRFATAKNHSATHLLHALLRKHCGTDVMQAGSFNNAAYLRLDFHCSKQEIPLAVLATISHEMKGLIAQAIEPEIRHTSLAEAQKQQALAFFKQKYQTNRVRMVRFGNFSLELCGGTHVHRTSDLEQFLITNCTLISRNKWRIYALTGAETVNKFLKTWKLKLTRLVKQLQPFASVFAPLKALLHQVANTDFYLAQKTLYAHLLTFQKRVKVYQTQTMLKTLVTNYKIPAHAFLVIHARTFCFHQIRPFSQHKNLDLTFLRQLYDAKLQQTAAAMLFLPTSADLYHLFIKLPEIKSWQTAITTFLAQFRAHLHFGVRKQTLQGVFRGKQSDFTVFFAQLRIFCQQQLPTPETTD